MKIVTNPFWVFYIDEESLATLKKEICGKWMYFFKDKKVAEEVCKKAVINGIVVEAKHTNADNGVCCFYLNGDDIENHKKVITFFIENNLIPKTKSGRFYNISFKYDNQTRAGEYGGNFTASIKLEDFINLKTEEWL